MAKKMNFWLKGKVGRLAGTTIYKANGVTRQREIVTPANPRTSAQMEQRVKLANLVNFYRISKPWIAKAFETKKSTQSDYNMLVKLNINNNPVSLTKGEAAAAACVVAPYQVSQGSLAPITFVKNEENGGYVSSICLGNEEASLESWGAISTAILENTPGIVEGMQLSFIRYTQQMNSDTNTPYVVMTKYEAIIDPTSEDPEFPFPQDVFDFFAVDGKLYLAVIDNGNDGGFAMVWSHTVGGKVLVSSQFVQMVGRSTLAAYSSDRHKNLAILSYGSSGEVFLGSSYAGVAADVGDRNSILLRSARAYASVNEAAANDNWLAPKYGKTWASATTGQYIALKMATDEHISAVIYKSDLGASGTKVNVAGQNGVIVVAPTIVNLNSIANYIVAVDEDGNEHSFKVDVDSQGGGGDVEHD